MVYIHNAPFRGGRNSNRGKGNQHGLKKFSVFMGDGTGMLEKDCDFCKHRNSPEICKDCRMPWKKFEKDEKEYRRILKKGESA